MAQPGAPVGERGSAAADISQYHGGGLPSWSELGGSDPTEYVPELQWPQSVRTYEEMRNDSQLAALWHASSWPIRRYTWTLDPRDADPSACEMLAEDLGLSLIGGQPPTRRTRRFNFGEHLALALQGLIYGHYCFEQVGEVVDGVWRLRKLAPRPPRTIEEWEVADDGGLKGIVQLRGGDFTAKPIKLSVDRLVVYAWDREPGSWVGRSLLRSVYRNWLVKDRLIRIDSVNHERAGVGMPTIEAPEGASQAMVDMLQEMASSYRAGEWGGGALPHGAKLRLQGVEGAQPRTMESIKYHDEAMARAWLLMFMQLGQTQTGSRSLGEAFIDWFSLAQETVAEWIAETFTDYVIGDWFLWNYGEDVALPKLHYEPAQRTLAVAELKTLMDAGALVADPNLRAQIRVDHGLPPSANPDDEPVEPPPVALPPTLRPDPEAEVEEAGVA